MDGERFSGQARPAAGARFRRGERGDGRAQPRRNGPPAHPGCSHDGGTAPAAGQAARLCVHPPGELVGLAAPARLQPHQPPGVQSQRAVLRPLRGRHGLAVAGGDRRRVAHAAPVLRGRPCRARRDQRCTSPASPRLCLRGCGAHPPGVLRYIAPARRPRLRRARRRRRPGRAGGAASESDCSRYRLRSRCPVPCLRTRTGASRESRLAPRARLARRPAHAGRDIALVPSRGRGRCACQSHQQSPGCAPAPPGSGGDRARGGAGGAHRRQRRSQPHLRGLAGDPAVAPCAAPARRGTAHLRVLAPGGRGPAR